MFEVFVVNLSKEWRNILEDRFYIIVIDDHLQTCIRYGIKSMHLNRSLLIFYGAFDLLNNRYQMGIQQTQ